MAVEVTISIKPVDGGPYEAVLTQHTNHIPDGPSIRIKKGRPFKHIIEGEVGIMIVEVREGARDDLPLPSRAVAANPKEFEPAQPGVPDLEEELLKTYVRFLCNGCEHTKVLPFPDYTPGDTVKCDNCGDVWIPEVETDDA